MILTKRGSGNAGKTLLRFCMPLLGAVMLCGIPRVQAQAPDLADMSIDQLAKVDVTSVSRKEQPIGDAATAIYVITASDIHDSTASTIPELLRMVPGLDVAQINGSTWAVSARGFASPFANKMLVLVDGHSILDPLFSGAYWSQQDLPLSEIARIEIIRGPGATIWGTNAVNGVINVITKNAAQTQGASLMVGAGDERRSFTTARYGGGVGKFTRYRIYSQYSDNGPAGDLNGEQAHDSSRSIRGGFRIDSAPSERNSFMLESEISSQKVGADDATVSYTPPYSIIQADHKNVSGEDFLGRWVHTSPGSETSAQVSYAHVVHPYNVFNIDGNVVTLGLQNSRPIGQRHNLVMGVEYSVKSATTSSPSGNIFRNSSDPSYSVASGFVQDEMALFAGAVRLTGGLRLDRNSFSGIDLQPNARALWKINPRNSAWAAYSQANRGASPLDATLNVDAAIVPGPQGLETLRVIGNPNLKSEKLHAFELGYRFQPGKTISFDSTAFYNAYRDLIGVEPGVPFPESGPPPRTVFPLISMNNLYGGSMGGEVVVKWIATSALSLNASYSLIEFDLHQKPGMAEGTASLLEGQTPRHQIRAGSALKVAPRVALNTWLSFVDSRPTEGIPGYTQVDSSLVWRALPSSEFSIGARNLFNKEHYEMRTPEGGPPTLLGRSIYGKLTWHSRD